MLGKILKYEFKATARIFVLLYLALLLVALVNALLLPVDAYNTVAAVETTAVSSDGVMQIVYSTIISLTSFAYGVLVIGTMLMTLVISVVRFYNLLGKEGYLWLTLPTTINSHILGKLICSLVWFVASAVIVLLSVGVLLLKTGWIGDVPEAWAALVGSGVNIGLFLVLIVATAIMSWLGSVLSFYTACAIGPNIIKSRLGGSAIVYVIIYCIQQALTTAALMLGALFMNYRAMSLSQTVDFSQTAVFSPNIDLAGLVFLGGDCVLIFLFSVVLYCLTRHFMTRKLNLA
jgi:hypothetical protein